MIIGRLDDAFSEKTSEEWVEILSKHKDPILGEGAQKLGPS